MNLYPLSGCTLTFEALHIIDQVVLNDLNNLLPKNSYTVLNAKASYVIKPVTIFASVNNLLDSRFELFPTSNGTVESRRFNPAPGLNVQFGANVTF